MSRVRRRIRPSDRPVAVLLAGVVTLFGFLDLELVRQQDQQHRQP